MSIAIIKLMLLEKYMRERNEQLKFEGCISASDETGLRLKITRLLEKIGIR